MIRNRFASEINSEVIESLLPTYFRREVDKQNLKPISQPRIYDLQMNPGAPLRFKAAFEVLPEIEVAGYEGLTAEKGDVSISDKEVEDELNALREQQASYDGVDEDRPLREGDWAMVSFTGTPKAEPQASGLVDAAGNPIASSEPPATSNEKPPVQMDEVLVEIGGANTVKEFTENLLGAQAGEERSFEVSYPADYNEQRLAGKTLVGSSDAKKGAVWQLSAKAFEFIPIAADHRPHRCLVCLDLARPLRLEASKRLMRDSRQRRQSRRPSGRSRNSQPFCRRGRRSVKAGTTHCRSKRQSAIPTGCR